MVSHPTAHPLSSDSERDYHLTKRPTHAATTVVCKAIPLPLLAYLRPSYVRTKYLWNSLNCWNTAMPEWTNVYVSLGLNAAARRSSSSKSGATASDGKQQSVYR